MSVSRARAYRAKPADQQAKRIDRAAPHGTHSPGWPHLDKHGNCLCLLGCCIGPGGERCRDCSHQSHPGPS